MPGPVPRERRFSDREVSLILKRAADLQESGVTPPPYPEGLTLGELQEIAQEAGIDPAQVQRAVADLDAEAVPAGSPFLGGPSRLQLEDTVNGEIPEAELASLVDLIQSRLGAFGFAQVHGSSLTWRSSESARQVFVNVVSRSGVTSVRIEERLGAVAGGLFGGLMGGIGGGVGGPAAGLIGGLLGSVGGALLAAGACVAGSYILARALYGSVVRKRYRDLGALLADLRVATERFLPPR